MPSGGRYSLEQLMAESGRQLRRLQPAAGRLQLETSSSTLSGPVPAPLGSLNIKTTQTWA